ncbi:MAG: Gfo/Idh/MocA family protein [Thermomicrobiales bacterium]
MTDSRTRRLRVGVIGCGMIAQRVHLPILTGLPDVEVTALAEPDPQRRAEAAALAPTAATYADYSDLLAAADVDAVVVCLPSALHASAAIAALAAGKHLYLEKPLATDLDEGRGVLEAWRRAGTVGMIGFNYRFNRLYEELRGHVQSAGTDGVGEVVAVRSVFSTATSPQDWRQTRQAGGGALLDLASHHVDLVRFLLDREVHRVFAALQSRRGEGDVAMLELLLDGGAPVQSLFSLSTVEEDRIEIYGRSGKLAVDRYLSPTVQRTGPTLRGARMERLAGGLRSVRHGAYTLERIRAPGNEPSYGTALRRFVVAALADRPDLGTPDLFDGYQSLAVVAAAEEAARTGCTVTLAASDEARPSTRGAAGESA